MELYRMRIEGRPLEAESADERRRTEDIERKLRLAGLRAERNVIFSASRTGELQEEATRRLVRELDLLEARYGA